MMCPCRQDAEDAVTDAYLKAFGHWERISGYPPHAAEKWVHTTMKRDLWKAGRRRKKEEQLALEVPVAPQSSVEDTAEARRALAAIANLPQRQRVVMMAHLEGLPDKEIAKRLRVRPSTVRAHLFQARRTLERLLDLTPEPSRPGERLVRIPVPSSTSPQGADDPLATLLLNTEAWLTEGIAAHGEALERIRQAIASSSPDLPQ
jgi:RNA polymerase sigma-70 factor (ECF subfamily)